MIDKTLFSNFDKAVDSFDFSLKKGKSGSYILEIIASSRGKKLGVNVIILETEDISIAINRAVKCINDVAREVVPGIRISGDMVNALASQRGITLKASKEEPAVGISQIFAYENEEEECPCPFCCAARAEDEEENFKQEIVEEVSEILDDIEYSVNSLVEVIRELLLR